MSTAQASNQSNDAPRVTVTREAAEYALTLQSAGAERGLVAFNALPVRLAHATLLRVEQAGPGSKITRSQVYAIVQSLNRALDRGEPAVELG